MLEAARAAKQDPAEPAHWMVVVDGKGPVHDAVQLVEIVRLSWREAEPGDDPSKIDASGEVMVQDEPGPSECRRLWIPAKGLSLMLTNLDIANTDWDELDDNADNGLVDCDGDW